TFRLTDVATGKNTHPGPGREPQVSPVVFAPDGRTIATLGDGRSIQLWRSDTGEELRCFHKRYSCPARLSFSPDGKFLGVLSGFGFLDVRGFLDVWDVVSGEQLGAWGPMPFAKALTFYSDPKWQLPLNAGIEGGEGIEAFHLSGGKTVC